MTTITLHHFSSCELVGRLRPIRGYTGAYKPTDCAWLSDESDYGWSQWCRENDWALAALQWRYRFEVDSSRLIVLSSQSDLIAFTAKYRRVHDTGLEFIDWASVKATGYAGVLISPYQWACRLSPATFWYYGWDCASACVWDVGVLSKPILDQAPRSQEACT